VPGGALCGGQGTGGCGDGGPDSAAPMLPADEPPDEDAGWMPSMQYGSLKPANRQHAHSHSQTKAHLSSQNHYGYSQIYRYGNRPEKSAC